MVGNIMGFLISVSFCLLFYFSYVQSRKMRKDRQELKKLLLRQMLYVLKNQTQILENIITLQEEIAELRAQIKKGIDNQE